MRRVYVYIYIYIYTHTHINRIRLGILNKSVDRVRQSRKTGSGGILSLEARPG